MVIIRRYIYGMLCLCGFIGGLASCSDIVDDVVSPADGLNTINIGGVETEALAVSVDEPARTRASEEAKKDAETVDWLLDPLFNGLDITYRINATTTGGENKSVAILKLEKKNPDGGNTASNIKKSEGDLAVYSFMYRSESTKTAQWFGNGYHYFEGVYVPNEIRFNPGQDSHKTTDNQTLNDITKENGSAPALNYDQSMDMAQAQQGTITNYTLLERYLGMPANWGHNATIDRIKLPFKHRLARVIAYVLIDPVLAGVNIKGYKKNGDGNTTDIEDATNSSIRFCNVKVLNGVEEAIDDTEHATLTPRWTEARKAIPHFVDERGSINAAGEVYDADHFVMYYKTDEKEYIFPANDKATSETSRPWTTAKNAWEAKYNEKEGTDAEKIAYADKESGYVRTYYGKVPVYDLIVRPTYSSTNNVMYDEDVTANTKEKIAAEENEIDFEITLENGLQYEKKFKFDLDANYQTIVYLRIKPESVDYSSSGAEVWVEDGGNDGYYGVNNHNGNTLSMAGNSWQRAYRIGSRDWDVTDGHYYKQDDEDKYAQYVDDATWVEMLTEAREGGKHHGDYFILEKNITIDASKLPIGFVFTGHLDGQNHTITLTGINSWAKCDNETLDKLKAKTGTGTGDDAYFDVPDLYWMEEVAQGRPRTRSGSIPAGNAIEIVKAKTKPTDIAALEAEGKVILYKENDVYKLYTNRDFYKKTGGSLFEGLNGKYTTAQEGNASLPAAQWEANVHKENNKWVPVKGYRAELLNVRLNGGTFFPTDVVYTGAELNKADATVSGYIFNCWEGSDKKENIVPIPQY